MNLKYRLKYVKKDNLIFISHLDILKVLQRAFRRAGLNLEHSKGFNPHPKVHFAPPLPLFTSSMGEYVDVETREDFNEKELQKRLNNSLPDNLQIIKAEKLEENAKSLGKSLDSAIYNIIFTFDDINNISAEEISDFIVKSDELNITKKNKKGRTVTKNIKPSIFNFKCEISGNNLIINTKLSLRTDEILSPTNVINILRENFAELNNAKKVKLEKKDTLLFSN
ncbi:radical SAM-linked protein [Anaerofustis stercorihominis DSM 17244]|uniref:Radical SAM-linked protein n=1 Tax=Anaerofustis stercorihominis DSM 17244 TaxID=445971 RepID=B1CBL3_9FIRM|nr:radical SAM-linked protein [Anaerofustis stercorihominis DSM 17244]